MIHCIPVSFLSNVLGASLPFRFTLPIFTVILYYVGVLWHNGQNLDACHVGCLLSSSLLSKNLKIKIYRIVILPVTLIINGVSDHDAQLLIITTDYSLVPTHTPKTIRKINKYTISDFIDKLNCESWDTAFNSEDVNTIFNSFLDTYLRIFYSSFPIKKASTQIIMITKTESLQALKHHADIRGNCTSHAELVIT